MGHNVYYCRVIFTIVIYFEKYEKYKIVVPLIGDLVLCTGESPQVPSTPEREVKYTPTRTRRHARSANYSVCRGYVLQVTLSTQRPLLRLGGPQKMIGLWSFISYLCYFRPSLQDLKEELLGGGPGRNKHSQGEARRPPCKDKEKQSPITPIANSLLMSSMSKKFCKVLGEYANRSNVCCNRGRSEV